MKRLAAAALLSLVASSASGQTIEVGPIVGYTPAADIHQKAVGVQDLEVAGDFTWGAQAAYFFSERYGVELLWTRQSTEMKISTSSGSASIFDFNLDLLHGNFVYQ